MGQPETGKALANLVRERPDDWEAWLVFADWLAEHGDVRGQLIRSLHRLATEKPPTANDRINLKVQVAETNAPQAFTAGLDVPAHTDLQWHRGFVHLAGLQWCESSIPFLEALITHPAGWLVSAVAVRGIDADGLAAFLAGEWPWLSDLDLSDNRLGDAGATAIANTRGLRGLRNLNLSDNRIGDAGAQALARANLPALQLLDLGHNRIGDAGVEALASDALNALPALEALFLNNNRVGDRGARALACSEPLRALKKLVTDWQLAI